MDKSNVKSIHSRERSSKQFDERGRDRPNRKQAEEIKNPPSKKIGEERRKSDSSKTTSKTTSKTIEDGKRRRSSDETEFPIVGLKYKMIRKIGSGSFGDIYLGLNMSNGEEVAIKIESLSSKHPQLMYESKVYNFLQGGLGIPSIRYFGQENERNILIMDLLGPCLEDLFNFCSRRFSLKTVLMLADQMIARLEFIHNKHFIHRDVKPANFLMGIGKHINQVFVVDFGLAKKYKCFRTKEHIPYREGKSLTGTARYASTNAHLGIEQSRRDDLESLGYVLVYFLRGSLPWQGMKTNTKKRKYDKISEMKLAIRANELCEGFPDEFALYFDHCYGLSFRDTPDYSHLRDMFRTLFRSLGFQYDYVYDWHKQKKEKLREGRRKSTSSSFPASRKNVTAV